MVQSRKRDVFKNHLSESEREQTLLNSDSSHDWVIFHTLALQPHHFLSYIIFFLTKDHQSDFPYQIIDFKI